MGGGGVQDPEESRNTCIYTLAPRAKNCKLLVIRDRWAFNSQSFMMFIVSFIMQTKCIQLFLQIYNAQVIEVDFLQQQKEHIFNSFFKIYLFQISKHLYF